MMLNFKIARDNNENAHSNTITNFHCNLIKLFVLNLGLSHIPFGLHAIHLGNAIRTTELHRLVSLFFHCDIIYFHLLLFSIPFIAQVFGFVVLKIYYALKDINFA